MTMTEFLLARIAEDEAVVHALRDADQSNWYLEGGPEFYDFEERFTDARLVAEVEAKRRIVELHAQKLEIEGCDVCHADLHVTPMAYPCTTLELLALPYADHPDFDSEWRN